ncbi:MAG: phosphatidyl-myo-inositol alpha-mannosyltransferase [Candidatus Saccharimonadales bacterium]
MKIGIVCPYDLTRNGGVQEHVLAQAFELRRRGHVVKIVTPKPRKLQGNVAADVLFIGNSRHVKAVKTSMELGISIIRDQVDDLLTSQHFDLLHVHEPEVPIINAQIVAKATCPIIATFHAMHPETAMGRTIETIRIPFSKAIFNKIRIMTAVSDAAAQFVRQRVDHDVVIIPNGIDLKKYRVKRSQAANPTILYIGRLEKRKGVRYLLKAFAELRQTQPDIRLIIAGDGELRKGLEDYVASNLIQNVTFKGFVSETEKLSLLATADVFCSPALFGESFGIVLLEAMAAGAPIVAGDNPGYSAVLTEHGKISLVNPRDTQDFSRRLDIFLHDDAIRKMWLTWAESYIQQFAYEKIVNTYEYLYQQALLKK